MSDDKIPKKDDVPQPQAAAAAATTDAAPKKMPTAVFLIGMAGTGKTTLTQRINHHCVSNNLRAYFVNIDPAVLDVPFAANIDIRDTVSHKEVMSKFRLGPNGAIMTSLNIFATKINEVLALIEKRADELDYVFIDTPGQIEVFTWSASGQMITEAFAATMPTCMLFVADAVRCSNPQTFMSTMLYSCSVMYKSQLPLCVTFNKCDITDGSRVTAWLQDQDAFSAALKQQKTFAATLSDSLGLFMHEFYNNISYVTVSAMEGSGMRELFEAVAAARETFVREYEPLLAQRQGVKEAQRLERAKQDAVLLGRDVAASASASAHQQHQQHQQHQENPTLNQPSAEAVSTDGG